jgi:hypothetical protein
VFAGLKYVREVGFMDTGWNSTTFMCLFMQFKLQDIREIGFKNINWIKYAGDRLGRPSDATTIRSFIQLLSECPQCYCGKVRHVLTFLAGLYCPKAYHRPDHSILIAEYNRSKSL